MNFDLRAFATTEGWLTLPRTSVALPLSVLSWGAQMILFHAVGLVFDWCDRRGSLNAFKVRPVDRISYRQMLPRVLFNQCFVLLPCMVFLQCAGLAFVGPTHLGWMWFLAAMFLMTVGHDVVMYVTHRYLLHHPRFKRLGHHVHHSTDASRSIGACYMSPADFFLEITCPYLVPLVLVGGGGADPWFHLIVPCLGALGGLYEHSGYDFGVLLKPKADGGRRRWLAWVPPSFISSQAHAEHHRHYDVSYSDGFGSPGLCDSLLGTRWDKKPHKQQRA